MIRNWIWLIIGVMLLLGCGGSNGPTLTGAAKTHIFTIAEPETDSFGYNRSRRTNLEWCIWKIDDQPRLAFGCWESYQWRDKWRMFLRYAIDLPAGAEVKKARLVFTGLVDSWSDQPGDSARFDAKIYLGNYDDGGNRDDLWFEGWLHENWQFEEELSLIDMATDPAPITWSLPASSWRAGKEYFVDITVLVQAFVNRLGYVPGNHMVLIVHEGNADDGAADNPGSHSEDAFRMARSDAGALPVLIVDVR